MSIAVLNSVAQAIASSLTDELAGSPSLRTFLLDSSVPEQRRLLLEYGVRVQLTAFELHVAIGNTDDHHVHLPARLLKRGSELKLVVQADSSLPAAPNPVLLKLLSQAHLAQQALSNGGSDALVSRYSKAHLAGC